MNPHQRSFSNPDSPPAADRKYGPASPTVRRYPSDLTERQWEAARRVIAATEDVGRRERCDLRRIMDAVNYRWRTGCSWRMLPHDFPPWQSVYRHFRHWRRAGRLTELRDLLLRRAGRSETTVNDE